MASNYEQLLGIIINKQLKATINNYLGLIEVIFQAAWTGKILTSGNFSKRTLCQLKDNASFSKKLNIN